MDRTKSQCACRGCNLCVEAQRLSNEVDTAEWEMVCHPGYPMFLMDHQRAKRVYDEHLEQARNGVGE